MPGDCKVFVRMSLPHPGIVFPEGNVQYPVELGLYAPMGLTAKLIRAASWGRLVM